MPINVTQLSSVIRYHLNQLKPKNAHHDFEHLCRNLARLRVYSNVIPATGPVSAGGDGGRDFETYRTNVFWPLLGDATFAKRSSGLRVVAFACSLNDEIEAKIRSDVRSVLDKGPVDEIVFFGEPDLPVAKRHALQRWSKTEHNVELQIFDGQAISELLADRETLWIAHEYLRLPAELALQTKEQDRDAKDALVRWRERDPVPFNHADFLEIKAELRHATFTLDARTNLGFWMQKMAVFAGPSVPRSLQRAAQYEIAVAALRGKGELDSEIGRVRDFMRDIDAFTGLAELQDAATLTVYVLGASVLGQVRIDANEAFGWRTRLVDLLENEIAAAPGPGRRSGLLRVRGYICIVPEAPETPAPFDETFVFWNQMLDEAERSPQFPIEDFVDHLAKVVAMFGSHPQFADLAERADGLLAKRSGPAVAAERIFERALSYYEQDKLTDAIRELQRAQTGSLTGDTMAAFLKATYLTAQCYGELHCAYAAKYHALVGAYVAHHSDDPLVRAALPRMLFTAADADDRAGNSLGFVTLLTWAIGSHVVFDRDPLDTDTHPEIQTQLGQVAALRGLALRDGGGRVALIDALLKRWPEPIRAPVIASSQDTNAFWAVQSMDETWSDLQEAFLNRPFSDTGRTRTIAWRALGIYWSISFNNGYANAARFERFAAEAQIALVALAGTDLCLLPVSIDLELKPGGKVRKLKSKPGNGSQGSDFCFALTLPAGADSRPEDEAHHALWVIFELVRYCSVLPDKDLTAQLEAPLKAALKRVFIGRPFEELYAEFMPKEHFAGARRRSLPIFGGARSFSVREHPLLAWTDGPGPGYSSEAAHDAIQGRYRRALTCAHYTIAALIADPATRSRLQALHDSGARDWEILSIVANAVFNNRLPIPVGDEPQDHLSRYQAALNTNERPEDALDPMLFTADYIDFMQRLFQGAFLGGWGLVLASKVFPALAVERFLIARYGLRRDDEEHDDIFGWQTPGNGSSD